MSAAVMVGGRDKSSVCYTGCVGSGPKRRGTVSHTSIHDQYERAHLCTTWEKQAVTKTVVVV